MTEKKNGIYTIAIIFSIIFVLGVMDFVNDIGMMETFLYDSDHFVGKEKWQKVKMSADILFGKREYGDMYMSSEGFLIVRHDPEYVDESRLEDNVKDIADWVVKYDAKVMLIPTADNCLSEQMPSNAPYYDDNNIFNLVLDYIPKSNYVNVFESLREHNLENIYLSGEDALTDEGLYYAYLAWSECANRYPLFSYADTADDDTSVTSYNYRITEKRAGLKIYESDRKNNTILFIVGDGSGEEYVPMFSRHFQYIHVLDYETYERDINKYIDEKRNISSDVIFISNCKNLLN